MQILLFLLVAIALYVGCDGALRLVERRVGRRLEQRSLVFFAMLLGSAMIVFGAIQHFAGD